MSAACAEKRVSLKLVAAFTHIPYGYLKMLAKGETLATPDTLTALEEFFGPIPDSARCEVSRSDKSPFEFMPEELPNSFAKWLLNARARLNLAQTSLTRYIGIRQSRLCGLETGKKMPTAKELQSLLDFLGPLSASAAKWLEQSLSGMMTLGQAYASKLSSFGFIIRTMRSQRGLSLIDLSRMINPTCRKGQPAHDIEYGIKTITPELLQKLISC